MPKNLQKWLIFCIFVVYLDQKIEQPLEQVRSLCKSALRTLKSTSASFESFFKEAMVGVLTINGRINFLQLARYCKSCEQRFRQNFRKKFDWVAFNRFFVDKQPGHRYSIAFDQSYISKSGKHTPGVGYFWSGCAQAVKHGLEISGLALVDADTGETVALRASQTLVQRIRKGRRPKCVEQVERESLISHYLLVLHDYKKQLLELSKVIAADAFFSKKTFVDGVETMGFNLVSRFRDDVRLMCLYTGEKTRGKGRPKKYDGNVDLAKLRKDVFVSETYDWDGKQVTIHSAVVYAVSLKRDVKAVIVDFEDPDKKTQTRKIFFSTDCSMSAKDVIDIYRSRFQIEFLFRDAKQFTGLCHCQARDEMALDFAFNLSLSAINVAKAFGKQNNLKLSVADCKLLFHNALLIERFLSTFGKMPNMHKNHGQKEHYFKDLLLFGLKAAG